MTPAWVALGSRNPAKRRAVETALERVLAAAPPRLTCYDVPSGVPAQPWGDAATRAGARNRATRALRRAGSGCDIGVGIEGGVEREGDVTWSFSWCVAVSRDGREGAARSAAFQLPGPVAALLASGIELGDAVDRVSGLSGSKLAGGAVGLLTRGAVDRPALYGQLVALALMPVLRTDLFG